MKKKLVTKKEKTAEEIEWSLQFSLKLKEVVKKKMKERGYQAETLFLDKIGLDQRLYYRLWEGGNPTLYTICRLAKILAIHPKELVNFDMNKRVKRTHRFHPIR